MIGEPAELGRVAVVGDVEVPHVGHRHGRVGERQGEHAEREGLEDESILRKGATVRPGCG